MKWINEVPSTSSWGCVRTSVVHPGSMLSRLATARNTSARNVQCPAPSRARSRSRMIYGVPSFVETIAWFRLKNYNSKKTDAIINNFYTYLHGNCFFFHIFFYKFVFFEYISFNKQYISFNKKYISFNKQF